VSFKKIFERCCKYGNSLNPKKIIFDVSEVTLLGHIIAKSGIKLDPERIKTIAQIPFPVNNKVMQSFLGKINFLHKFIFNYAYIVKPWQEMVKKYEIYKWDNGEKDAFYRIKQAIVDVSTLFSPNYGKDFLLYTFASD